MSGVRTILGVTLLLALATPVAALCGNGILEGGEACDDGNLLSADGCSAGCIVEAPLSSGEKRCVTFLLRRAAGVAKAQAKLVEKCVREAAKEREPFPQVCVVLDEGNNVVVAERRLQREEGKRCSPPPPWGIAGAAVVAEAAREAVLDTVADLLGENLNLSIVEAADDRQAARCQGAVLKAVQQLVEKQFAIVEGCLKAGLVGRRALPILSPDAAARCLEALDVDDRGRLAKATEKIGRMLAKRCRNLETDWMFPGRCRAAPDFAACVRDRGECRVCRGLNAMAGLGADCDAMDDGSANLSCP